MNTKSKNSQHVKWTAKKACDWYQSQPWLCGFNFLPSTAISYLEMWQRGTFDLETIDRELGWAQDIGFNSCRVCLDDLVWNNDSDGLIKRIDQFLEVAHSHKISTMPCFFTSCPSTDDKRYLGKQLNPVPGTHGGHIWVPAKRREVIDRSAWPQLENFITTIVSRFSTDERISIWDICNEPDAGVGDKCVPFLHEAFQWARNSEPQQPLTAGIWHRGLPTITGETLLALSDIISFHSYDDLSSVQTQVSYLKWYGRPIVCTEWMARHYNSLFQTHLPFFKREKIGCYSWGLVTGKTQTRFPWRSPQGAPEPALWFHDLLHPDGKPYRQEEIEIIRQNTQGPV